MWGRMPPYLGWEHRRGGLHSVTLRSSVGAVAWCPPQAQLTAGKVQASDDPILRNPKRCRLESLDQVPNAHMDSHTNTPRGGRRTRTVGSFHSRFF